MRILLFISILFSLEVSAQKVSRLRATWSKNPSTSMQLIWEALDRKGASHVVYYDSKDHGRDYRRYSYKQKVTDTFYYKGMYNVFSHLHNLLPDTKYYFVIKTTTGVSKRFFFETIPNRPFKRLSFIAGGDSRNNRSVRKKANYLVSRLRPHAVFFGGDMTNWDVGYQWRRWFDDWQLTISNDGRLTPIVVARGNHERSNESIERLFRAPQGVVYNLKFGGNLFSSYTLNTHSSNFGVQRNWLMRTLPEDDSLWKFVQYHRPMRPHTRKKKEGSSTYKSWAKLFYDYKVDLVSESDSHTVKSTYPIRPTFTSKDEGFIRDDERGTIYVGEGGWGAPLRVSNDLKVWTRAAASFNQFKLLYVDAFELELRTIKVFNAYDVASVGEDRFKLPSNLSVWDPQNSTGSVIRIKNKNLHALLKENSGLIGDSSI